MTFEVIDPKTGEYPDLEHIARTEEWAQNLIPCDMEGFCINEDGNLILMDECGNYAYCLMILFCMWKGISGLTRNIMRLQLNKTISELEKMINDRKKEDSKRL